jgi:hypothetical protein
MSMSSIVVFLFAVGKVKKKGQCGVNCMYPLRKCGDWGKRNGMVLPVLRLENMYHIERSLYQFLFAVL